MADVGSIATTVPATEVQVSGTNLFRVAATQLGDATQWDRVARLNGLVDPWIGPVTLLSIPGPGTSSGGVLG